MTDRCFKLQQYFTSHKDYSPTQYRSSVVYQLTCNKCGATYVGETDRNVITRFEEHTDTTSSAYSAIKEHMCDINNIDHKFLFEDVKILGTAQFYYKRRILEALYAQKHKPTIINRDKFPMHLKLFNI